MTERSLILDFDGTVCVGHRPALVYAHQAAGLHPDLADLAERIERYCAGEAMAEFEGAPDGYIAVQRRATAQGVPISALQAAFMEARRQLADTGLDTRAPEGLRPLLDELRGAGTRLLLVTNAPPHGLDRMLVHLGLDGAFDDVIADAGKPAGLGDILDGLGHPVAKDTVLSIGDIFLNDLSVPLERGASTALIDPFDRVEGDPDVRARTFEELIPFIRAWARLDGE